jgi:hypothetical protein
MPRRQNALSPQSGEKKGRFSVQLKTK